MKNLHIKIRKKFYVDILFGVLLLITFLRYGMEINIPTSIMLCVSLFIITCGNNSEIIAMCLCCIPLHTSFDYLYVILYGCVVLLLKNLKKIKIDYMLIIILTIFLWELLHSIEGPFLIKQFVGNITPYMLVLSLHLCRRARLDYRYITMMFARFVILIGIDLLLRTLKMYGESFSYAIQQMGRLGNLKEDAGILGGQINPNSLGIMCVLAITMLLQNYLYHKKEKEGITYILLLLIIGMLTLSKTYIVLLILTGCLFIVEQKSSNKEKLRTLAIISVISICGGLILVNVFPTVLETFVERWKVNDLSTGRFAIMAAATGVLQSNSKILWFGLGIQNYAEEVLKYVYYAPHDVIHEIIFVWGVPGVIIFSVFILALVREAKKVNKHIKTVNYIPLIIIIAKALAGHWITSDYTMLSITLLYLSLLHDFFVLEDVKLRFINVE